MQAQLTDSKPTGADLALHAGEGLLGLHRVVCVLAGKGELQIPGRIERALARWEARDVFLVGIAGGFVDQGVRRGDVVVAKQIYCFDFGKLTADGGFLRRADFDDGPSPWLLDSAMIQASRPAWRARIRVVRPDGRPVDVSQVHDGYVASSNTLVDDPADEWFQSARRSVPGELHAVEMEGAGAATSIRQVQDIRSVRFLMVRGISDEPGTVGAGGSGQRRAWKAYAAGAAAAFVASLIAAIAASETDPLAEAVLQRSTWAREALIPQTLAPIPRAAITSRVRGIVERGMRDAPRVAAIIGAAGHGKSTALGQVYDACAPTAGWAVLVRCSDIAVAGDLSTEALARAMGEAACGTATPIDELARMLTAVRGPGIVLVDTLDLVLTGVMAKALHQLLRRLLDARVTVIFTCRDVEFGAWCEPVPQRLPTVASVLDCVAIGAFTPEEVEQAARAFVTQARLPIDPDTFVRRLQTVSAHSRPLQTIVANPLLLGMLCDLFPEGYVPADLTVTELYTRYWDRYVADSRRHGPHAAATIAKQGLCLAFAARVCEQSGDRFRDAVDVPDVLSMGRSEDALGLGELLSDGTLIRSRSGQLTFFHQTFLEYVIARYLRSSSAMAARERVMAYVTGDDRGRALPWWPVVRQWLVLLDDASYAEVETRLGVTDVAAMRAVALAAAARPTPGPLSRLQQRAQGLGDEHDRLLCEAAASVTPALLDDGFQVALALLRSGSPSTSHQAVAVLGELMGRGEILGSRWSDVIDVIDERSARAGDGGAAAAERTQLLARLLSAAGESSAVLLPPTARQALRQMYGRVRAGARLHIVRVHAGDGVTPAERMALVAAALKHEISAEMVEPMAGIVAGLLSDLDRFSPREDWRSWRDVVLPTKLPSNWGDVQRRAVGRYVATDDTAIGWLVDVLFSGRAEAIESALVSLEEAARAGASTFIQRSLLERPFADLQANRVRPLGVLTREIAARLDVEARRALLTHLRAAIEAAPDKLVPLVIGLADLETLAAVPIESALNHVERGRRAVTIRELFRGVVPEARSALAAMIDRVISRAHGPGWDEARIEIYAVGARESASARRTLLGIAEGSDEELAAAAMHRFKDLVGEGLAAQRDDLRGTLTSRHDRVRLHALTIVHVTVDRGEPSALELIEDAVEALQDEAALPIRQLLLLVLATDAERHQRFIPGAAVVIDRALRDALNVGPDASAMTSSVFNTVRAVAQQDALVIDPSVREWGLRLLRDADLTRIVNAEVEVSTLLTALGRHYPGLLASLVAEARMWPPLVARALAIAVRRVEGVRSPLLDAMIGGPPWPAALVRLVADWRSK